MITRLNIRTKRITPIVLLIGLGCLAITIFAQNTPQKDKPKDTAADTVDQYSDVHQGIFVPQIDKGKDAARLTDDVSKGLPPGDTVTGKMPRKNLIDEYI